MEKSWNEDMEQSKKRKREWRSSSSSSSAAAAAGGGAIQNIYSQHQQQQQQPQQDVILQPQRSQWIDLTTSQIPLPPGWEQCLDLQVSPLIYLSVSLFHSHIYPVKSTFMFNPFNLYAYLFILIPVD